jgi:hypothetical protein
VPWPPALPPGVVVGEGGPVSGASAGSPQPASQPRRLARPPALPRVHVVRADLLRPLGRSAEANDAYDAAIAATQNAAERAYLARRRGEPV